MSKKITKQGFTLLEVVIAMVLAAGGLSIVYQSFAGAARLQEAATEMAQTRETAENILIARAGTINSGSSQSGIINGIAWSIQADPIATNTTGAALIRIRVLASGPMGREVQLVSEAIRHRP